MNLGIVLGAIAAARLAGKLRPTLALSWSDRLTAAARGLLLGHGARLAHGCNIGAFFSGVASGSLHGATRLSAPRPAHARRSPPLELCPAAARVGSRCPETGREG